MSRCFPYPPPGYERARTHDEALIESIKIQKEEEKAKKKRRKEKKCGKKEKARKDEKIDNKESLKRRHKDERSQEDTKAGNYFKRKDNEAEQLEKSTLTVEFGRPVGPQNLSDSTDSTLNTNKRQKHCVPSDGRHNPESIIRIRLPLQRHRDSEVLPQRMEHPCSDLHMTDASVQGKREAAFIRVPDIPNHPCAPVQRKYEVGPNFGFDRTLPSSSTIGNEIRQQKPHLASRVSEIAAEKPGTSSSLYVGNSSPVEMHFRNLDNWIPLPLHLVPSEYDDEDWLFKTKTNEKSGSKGSIAFSNGLSCANTSTWACACYLPEADIYALPFTVPF